MEISKVEDIQKILILGAGTMGRQIALQCALYGYTVALYDLNKNVLENAISQLKDYASYLVAEGTATEAMAERALSQIEANANSEEAATNVDLVSESVFEDPKIKAQVFAKFHQLCPSHTIFTTNTSTLKPSQFAQATGRAEQFCALHFHNPVISANVVDIMPHSKTSQATLRVVADFARSIDQIPIILQKEHNNYVFNNMLSGFLTEALSLVATDIASVEEIDRAWMGVLKTSIGPFGILDVIGIDLVYKIYTIQPIWARLRQGFRKRLRFLKGYVDQGKLGVKTGVGFYRYPNPLFQEPTFLQGDLPKEERRD